MSKVKTRLHTLTPAAEKHCDNLRYFSVLYSMRAIYTRSYKAKKIIDHHKFYSSSWTSELQVSVVRVQNLVVSDERTRERFFPWVGRHSVQYWGHQILNFITGKVKLSGVGINSFKNILLRNLLLDIHYLSFIRKLLLLQ